MRLIISDEAANLGTLLNSIQEIELSPSERIANDITDQQIRQELKELEEDLLYELLNFSQLIL